MAAFDQHIAGVWERLVTSTQLLIDAAVFMAAYKHQSSVLKVSRLEERLARYRMHSDYWRDRSASSGK